MRTTRTLSITLPPEMLLRAEALAREENRTMSELVREALRHYERDRWWNRMNTYGKTKAEERGLTEADVVSAVKAVRKGRAHKRQNGH
jgi:CopG family transcriptional regulator/antitoxin EndoAI